MRPEGEKEPLSLHPGITPKLQSWTLEPCFTIRSTIRALGAISKLLADESMGVDQTDQLGTSVLGS